MGIKKFRVKSRTIDFSIDTMGDHLKLPLDDLLLEYIHRLTRV